MIRFKKRATNQPASSSAVNFALPIAKSLKFLYVGGQTIELVRKAVPVINDAGTLGSLVATPQGKAFRLSGINRGLEYPRSLDYEPTLTTGYTHILYAKRVGTMTSWAGMFNVLYDLGSTPPNANWGWAFDPDANDQNAVSTISGDGTQTLHMSPLYSVGDSSQPFVLVVTRDTAGVIKSYVNGILANTDSSIGTGINTYDTSATGVVRVGEGDGEVYLAGLWHRPLSAAEVYSISKNPWQLFGSNKAYVSLSNYVLTAASGSFALSGKAAISEISLPLASGALALTGQVAGKISDYVMVANSGGFSLSGKVAGTLKGYATIADSRAFALSGKAADLVPGHLISADSRGFVHAGQVAGLQKDFVVSIIKTDRFFNKNHRTVQPQAVVALNKQSSFFNKLEFLHSGCIPFDIANGRKPWLTTLGTVPVASISGTSLPFQSGTSAVYSSDNGLIPSDSAGFTMFLYARRSGTVASWTDVFRKLISNNAPPLYITYTIQFNPDGLGQNVFRSGLNDGSAWFGLGNVTLTDATKPFMIAVTRVGGTVTIYVNGVYALSVSGKGSGWGSDSSATGALQLGAGWIGEIYQAATWNRAFSAAEVYAYCQNPWQLFAPPSRSLAKFVTADVKYLVGGKSSEGYIDRSLVGASGSFSLTAVDIDMGYGLRVLTANSIGFGIAGQAATLDYHPLYHYALTASKGTFALVVDMEEALLEHETVLADVKFFPIFNKKIITSQPQAVVALNKQSEFFDKLAFLHYGANPFEVARGRKASVIPALRQIGSGGLSFAGGGVTFSDDNELQPTDAGGFTLFVYARRSGTIGTFANMVVKQQDSGQAPMFLSYGIQFNASGVGQDIFGALTNNGSALVAIGANSVGDGTIPYKIVMTRLNGVLRVYINGVQVGSRSDLGSGWAHSTGAAGSLFLNSGWVGEIYQTATWNRAFSAAEVYAYCRNPWQLFAPKTKSAGTAAKNDAKYALRTFDATLSYEKLIAGDSGSFSAPLKPAGLYGDHFLTADGVSFSLSGFASETEHHYVNTAASRAFVLGSPNTPILVDRFVTAPGTSLAWTGKSADLFKGYYLGGLAHNLQISWSIAPLIWTRIFHVDNGSFIFSGKAAGYLLSRCIIADAVNFALNSGFVGTYVGRQLSALATALSLSGREIAFYRDGFLTANAGVFAGSYKAAALSIEHVALAGSAGFSLVFTGNLLADRGLALSSRAVVLTGQAAGLYAGRLVVSDAASLHASLALAALLPGRVLSGLPSSLTLTGAVALSDYVRCLTGVSGHWVVSGQVASLYFDQKLGATTGVYSLLDRSADLHCSRLLSAASRSVVVSGQVAGLSIDRLLVMDTRALLCAFTGALYSDKTLGATTGAYSLLDRSADLFCSRLLSAASRSALLSGQVAGLSPGRLLVMDAIALTCAFSGALYSDKKISAITGAYSLLDRSADLCRSWLWDVAAGALTVSGQAVAALKGHGLQGSAGAYELASVAAALLYARSFGLDAGGVTLTGKPAGVFKNSACPAASAVFNLAGRVVNLLADRRVSSETAELMLHYADALLECQRVLALDKGQYTLAGKLSVPLIGRFISSGSGSLNVIGSVTELLASHFLEALSVFIGVSGQSTGVLAGRNLAADKGALALSGQVSDLLMAHALLADLGCYTLGGGTLYFLKGYFVVSESGEFNYEGADSEKYQGYAIRCDGVVHRLTWGDIGAIRGRIFTVDAINFTAHGYPIDMVIDSSKSIYRLAKGSVLKVPGRRKSVIY